MVTLFLSHIRPIIEYCSAVWNVGYLGDMKKLESVQRRWTKEIAGVRDFEYGRRLREVGLYSIKGRLLRLDLIKMWKILNSGLNLGVADLFEFARDVRIRGHSLKLSKTVCGLDVRRFFAVRNFLLWNSVPTCIHCRVRW